MRYKLLETNLWKLFNVQFQVHIVNIPQESQNNSNSMGQS